MNIMEANDNAFSINNLKFAILKKNFTAAAGNAHNRYCRSKASQSLADAIKEQKDIKGIKKLTLKGLISKVTSMLMYSESDICMTFLLINYGVELLVAIKFRNWIARELEAILQILVILATDLMMNLVDIIVKCSKLILAEIKNENTLYGEVNQNKRFNSKNYTITNVSA